MEIKTEMLTQKEAARYLKVADSTAVKMMDDGLIQRRKRKSGYFIYKSQVDEFLKKVFHPDYPLNFSQKERNLVTKYYGL